MQTVGKLIGRSQLGAESPDQLLISTDSVGIEIELEGFSGDDMAKCEKMKYWSVKGDGSLRNSGVEFVTAGGFGGKSLIAAISEVDKVLSDIEFNASWRCSTHMHVNMLDFTLDQVVKYILAYICVEPILFDFCQPYRKHSNFCVPLTTSQGSIRRSINMLRENIFPRLDGNKYMALNVLPVSNHDLGTLEFRGSHALTTSDELIGLANRLISIKNFVRNFSGNMEEMIYQIEVGGWQQVLSAGIHEGYMPDYEAFEKAVMTAWGCHKQYAKGELNESTPGLQHGDIPTLSDAQQRRAQALNFAAQASTALEYAASIRGTSTQSWFSYDDPARPDRVEGFGTMIGDIVQRHMDREWTVRRCITELVDRLASPEGDISDNRVRQWVAGSPDVPGSTGLSVMRKNILKSILTSYAKSGYWSTYNQTTFRHEMHSVIERVVSGDFPRRTPDAPPVSFSASAVILWTAHCTGINITPEKFTMPFPEVIADLIGTNRYFEVVRRIYQCKIRMKLRMELAESINAALVRTGLQTRITESQIRTLSPVDLLIISARLDIDIRPYMFSSDVPVFRKYEKVIKMLLASGCYLLKQTVGGERPNPYGAAVRFTAQVRSGLLDVSCTAQSILDHRPEGSSQYTIPSVGSLGSITINCIV